MVDESLTRDEFVKSFDNVLQYVKKIEGKNTKDFQDMQGQFETMAAELKDGTAANVETLKQEVNSLVASHIYEMSNTISQIQTEHSQHGETLNAVEQRIAAIEEAAPATETKIVEQAKEAVRPLIPVKVDPETGQSIVDKINALDTEEDLDKIDWKHIKGFPEATKETKKNPSGGSGKYMPGQNININANIVSLSIPVQPTAPSNPSLNDLWIDNS